MTVMIDKTSDKVLNIVIMKINKINLVVPQPRTP